MEIYLVQHVVQITRTAFRSACCGVQQLNTDRLVLGIVKYHKTQRKHSAYEQMYKEMVEERKRKREEIESTKVVPAKLGLLRSGPEALPFPVPLGTNHLLPLLPLRHLLH